jgi:hypothetical protein
MQKFFRATVEIVFWLALFASPFFGSFVTAAIIYLANEKLYMISIIILGLGFIFGILLAEKIRRKYGCTNYMSRIRSISSEFPKKEDKIKKDDQSGSEKK